jgi:hypothetical protein
MKGVVGNEITMAGMYVRSELRRVVATHKQPIAFIVPNKSVAVM